jgi:hypothetical protein
MLEIQDNPTGGIEPVASANLEVVTESDVVAEPTVVEEQPQVVEEEIIEVPVETPSVE